MTCLFKTAAIVTVVLYNLGQLQLEIHCLLTVHLQSYSPHFGRRGVL